MTSSLLRFRHVDREHTHAVSLILNVDQACITASFLPPPSCLPPLRARVHAHAPESASVCVRAHVRLCARLCVRVWVRAHVSECGCACACVQACECECECECECKCGCKCECE